jgi:ubiquinone/menaquinone biosynthesis C-methylase UbiE
MDLGTGDGKLVLDRAAACPDQLVIGVDASASSMADASRRAARARLPNACFVVGDVGLLSAELASLADLVTVHFPWGSLLNAAVRADPAVTRPLRPGGTLRLLLSSSPRDGIGTLDPAAVEDAYAVAGFATRISRAATLDDAVAAHSSWGKRLLRTAHDRQAWLLELTQGQPPATSPSMRW